MRNELQVEKKKICSRFRLNFLHCQLPVCFLFFFLLARRWSWKSTFNFSQFHSLNRLLNVIMMEQFFHISVVVLASAKWLNSSSTETSLIRNFTLYFAIYPRHSRRTKRPINFAYSKHTNLKFHRILLFIWDSSSRWSFTKCDDRNKVPIPSWIKK